MSSKSTRTLQSISTAASLPTLKKDSKCPATTMKTIGKGSHESPQNKAIGGPKGNLLSQAKTMKMYN